MYEGIVPLSFK